MKYRIDDKKSQLDIDIEETGGKQQALLEAFQECQQGRCACPTDEYKKLASLEIESSDNAIKLHLKLKPGEQLETSELEQCLQHTIGQIAKE